MSSNGSSKILDRLMKTSMQKNKSSCQLPNSSSSIVGFGNIGNSTPFINVPSFALPNGSVDQVDGEMWQDGNQQETRRPSAISNDSNFSISSLKMRLSKSFSRSSDDNDPSLENIISSDKKSTKTSSKFSKLTKYPSAKTKKYSLINNILTDFQCQNLSSQASLASQSNDHFNGCSVQDNSYINNVLMELINTEKSYVRDLRDIEQGYHIPMSNNKLFSQDDIKFVFGNIRNIYRFSRKLLKRLLEHKDDVIEICQVFLKNRDGFDIYTNYCTNYLRSIETLERYTEVSEIDSFIKDLQKLMKHPLPLHTYLFKPVQRILKYHLLLKNIADRYDASSIDFKVVSEAYKCMTEVASEINDRKKKQEERIKLNQLLNSIQGLADINGNSLGELVFQGKLFSVGPREEIMMLLLERGLLIAKKRKDGILVYKNFILSSRLTLVEIIPREPLCFQVMSYDAPKDLCTLQARSVEDKMIWCREIKTVILDSIKADVPEKVRLLVMKGLCQDDDGNDIKQKMSRKMSADLEDLPTSGRSPKTSTPLTPFLRSKLRKTALGKFTWEKRNKAKSKVGKRRSRSLENLTKISNAYNKNLFKMVSKVPFVDKTSIPSDIFRDKPAVCSSPSLEIDSILQNTSPFNKSLNRASSFKEALNDENVFQQRITYSRSFSIAYTPSSDEDEGGEDNDDEDREDGGMKFDESESPLAILIPPRLGRNDSSTDESITGCSVSLERNDSTITLSSGTSFNEFNFLQSPGFNACESFDRSAEYFVNDNEIKTFSSHPIDEAIQKFGEQTDSFEEDGTSIDDNSISSYTLEVPRVFQKNTSEFDSPEIHDPSDDIDKSKKDDFDMIKLLRNKNKRTKNQFLNDHAGRRISLLKRKSAFSREIKKFIPRKSIHYIDELEEHRQSSLPSVFISKSFEDMEIYPDDKLCLSEDSLPISPPIDDDEMIDIIFAAAEESKVVKSEAEKPTENDDTVVPLKKGIQNDDDEDKNCGVVALLELIASCQDLSTEVNNSFEKIKLKEDFHPVGGEGHPLVNDISIDEPEIGNEFPSLKVSSYGSHLLRNKKNNYVFRLARAYSNRFKKLSGTGQDHIEENTDGETDESHLRSNHLPDPAIHRAEKSGIVKQRIQQFQHKVS